MWPSSVSGSASSSGGLVVSGAHGYWGSRFQTCTWGSMITEWFRPSRWLFRARIRIARSGRDRHGVRDEGRGARGEELLQHPFGVRSALFPLLPTACSLFPFIEPAHQRLRRDAYTARLVAPFLASCAVGNLQRWRNRQSTCTKRRCSVGLGSCFCAAYSAGSLATSSSKTAISCTATRASSITRCSGW